jgi:hypothetical protein
MNLEFDGKVSDLTVLPVRLFYGAAAIIGCLALIGLAFGADGSPNDRTVKAALGAAGLSFHASLGITAIVELGLSRYVLPLWPIVCVIMALAVLSLVQWRSRSRDLLTAPLESGPEPALA